MQALQEPFFSVESQQLQGQRRCGYTPYALSSALIRGIGIGFLKKVAAEKKKGPLYCQHV